MLRVSLRDDFYITWKDHVFIANVVVSNLTREMMALNAINQPIGAIMELNTIVKIHKYKGLHRGHHFIPMAMEVHGVPMYDMDHFIKKCAHFFHDKWLGSLFAHYRSTFSSLA